MNAEHRTPNGRGLREMAHPTGYNRTKQYWESSNKNLSENQEGPMADRKPYNRRATMLSAWMVKAILLIIAGGTTVMVALAIKNRVTVTSASDQGFRIGGVRHEATGMPSAVNNPTEMATRSSELSQEGSTAAVVRNGLTVVSPQLRVPIIDIDSLQAATGSDDAVSPGKASKAAKRSRYTKRSHASRQKPVAAKRWPAYGLAFR